MLDLLKFDVLKNFHSVVRVLFKQSGYEWELRRNGEQKIGLWRKKLHKAWRRHRLIWSWFEEQGTRPNLNALHSVLSFSGQSSQKNRELAAST